MSENLIEQLKSAANEPELSMEEYKEQRNAEATRRSERNDEVRTQPAPSDDVNSTDDVDVEEKEYKPWETETDKKEEVEEEDEDVIVTDKDNKVPLHKLLKLKAQKKEREAELERYKKEIAEYKTIINRTLPKEEAEVVIDPIERKLKELKEPNSMEYTDYDTYKRDYEQYKAVVKEIEEERVISRVRRSFEEEAKQYRAQEELKKTVNEYVAKIEKASETNPDIMKAVGWFENKMVEHGVEKFDRNIQQALINDDNAPELIHRVVKDKALVDEIFGNGNTVQILKKIGRLSTFIELEKDDDSDDYKPAVKKVIPRSLTGNQSGTTKDSSKADSMEEYKKLRRLEDMKQRRR